MDANGDGVLQFNEIIDHYKGVDSHVLDALKDMFKENDYNNDGVVSKRELFQLALRLIMLGGLGEEPKYADLTPEQQAEMRQAVNTQRATEE